MGDGSGGCVAERKSQVKHELLSLSKVVNELIETVTGIENRLADVLLPESLLKNQDKAELNHLSPPAPPEMPPVILANCVREERLRIREQIKRLHSFLERCEL